MKKVIALLLSLTLVFTLAPTSAAAKAKKENVKISLCIEAPGEVFSAMFAGLPDLTGCTLKFMDGTTVVKSFVLPEQSDLHQYEFSDSDGKGVLKVVRTCMPAIANGGRAAYQMNAQYETKNLNYYGNESGFFSDFYGWPLGSGPFPEMIQGQTEKIVISQKKDVKVFEFTAPTSGYYAFNITDDTSGNPYIVVRRKNGAPGEVPSRTLDFYSPYAHSVSISLGSGENVSVLATTLGAYFTGSFNLTVAPAVLNLTQDTIKARYHSIVPWDKILGETTYEPRDLQIVLEDGGTKPLMADGWYASYCGNFTVTIKAPTESIIHSREADFHVKVEYSALQWLCVILLGGFIWLPWTSYKL